MNRRYGLLFVAAMLASHAEADTTEQKIARALSAAPAAVSDGAMVMDTDGRVLREGNNGWMCMPEMSPGDASPMCHDQTWGAFMKAFASKSAFSTDRIGIAYMLQGDGVASSNDDPFETDPKKGTWVKEGPHLMILVPKEMLKGLPTTPGSGAPYVMWADTPYAHIMAPVGPRK